ncbi:MAG: TraR/DksA C4-type zinc finger protein [Chitinophagaceae bacterium]|nr:TraR/DksA C4-type zinc finger protein [Chitinophagaceae bacterium]
MATNKKAAKKTATSKAKATKTVAKKAVKVAKPAATKPAKATQSAKAVKPAKPAKPAKQTKPAKKAVAPKAPAKKSTRKEEKNKKVAAKMPVKQPTAKTKSVEKPVRHVAVKETPKEVKKVLPVAESQSVKAAKPEAAKKKVKEERETKPVVIPKLSTSHSRKYEPEFTQSVLDQPEKEPSGPTLKYSDAELVEFKELILRKLESAKKELNYLQGLITRKDDMGGDESENRYMTMEDGSISMEREQLSQMASRQIQYIDHLEKAMVRIENKTYGICRVTGKLIDKARLRAVPHATLSIEAKMGYAKNPSVQ